MLGLRRVAVIFAVVALSAVVPVGPALAARSRCARSGVVVASSRQVEVYRAEVNSTGPGGRHTDWFACRISTRRSLAFADPFIAYINVPSATVKIAGLFAAAAVLGATGSHNGVDVVVIDLRPSRPQMAFQGAAASLGHQANVTDLVLSSRGAVAWIVRTDPNSRSRFEVRAAGSNHVQRLLDSSAKIAPNSLRLSGSTLTWVDAGHRRSASLS